MNHEEHQRWNDSTTPGLWLVLGLLLVLVGASSCLDDERSDEPGPTPQEVE